MASDRYARMNASCNGESAYKGFEITMAVLRSVVERGQIKLPLGPGEPELAAITKVLPDRPVLLSTEASRKEYATAAAKA